MCRGGRISAVGKDLGREDGEPQRRDPVAGGTFSPEISRFTLHEIHLLRAPQLTITSGLVLRAA